MRALIIYKSVHHGNTKKVAEVIAKVLNADLKDAGNVNIEEVEKYEVIGIGSGIFFGKHHRSVLNFVERMPLMRHKKAFIFSTRGGTPTWINHIALRRKLKEKGFKIIGEFSCKGYDTFGILKYIGGLTRGKPDKRDLRRAANFAEEVRYFMEK